MNEIVKFESAAGLQVQITSDDVRNYLCENATDKEVMMFLQLCQAQKLNPFVRDAYLVKYGNAPATIITGKDVFLKRANANPDFEGFESGVTFIDSKGNVQRREGSGVYKAANETLVGGWCRVFLKGKKPFFDEVSLEEYSTGKSGWAKMPATMIRKVALVHALREAFPESFQGLYAQEEMGAVSNAHLPEAPIAAAAAEVESMITDNQQKEMLAKVGELAKMRGVDNVTVMKAVLACQTLAATGYVEGCELTEKQADLAITVLGNWIEKASGESELAEDDIEF